MDGHERLSSTGYEAVAVFSSFLLLAGSFTQLITLIVLLKQEYRKKVLTSFFLGIIISNSLFLYGSLPTTFVSSLNNGWNFDDKVCHFVGFVSGTGSISMIATMAVITVKIYLLAKNRPFSGNQIKPDNSQSKAVLLGIWLYSICTMLPPVTGITEMKIEGSGTNCVPNWSPENTGGRIYVTFLLFLAYVVPVSVSAIYIIKVRREISKNATERNYVFVNLCFRNLRNINKMCIFAVVFFTIAWLPYATVVVICMFGKKTFISPEMEMVPTLLAKTSAVFNPFIYAIVNPRFRNSILQLLRIRFLFSVNEGDFDVEIGSAFVLNEIDTNAKIGKSREITKARRDEQENETNRSEEVGRRSTDYTKRTYQILALKDVQSDGDGLEDKSGEYKEKTFCSEKHVKKVRFAGFQDNGLNKSTTSKDSYKINTSCSSSTSNMNSHYFSGSCSNFKLEKQFYQQSKQLRPKIESRNSSSSSTLNISTAYRACRITSSEIHPHNFPLPGKLEN